MSANWDFMDILEQRGLAKLSERAQTASSLQRDDGAFHLRRATHARARLACRPLRPQFSLTSKASFE